MNPLSCRAAWQNSLSCKGTLGSTVRREDPIPVLPLPRHPQAHPGAPGAHQLLSHPTPGEGNVLRGRSGTGRPPIGRCSKPGWVSSLPSGYKEKQTVQGVSIHSSASPSTQALHGLTKYPKAPRTPAPRLPCCWVFWIQRLGGW